MKIPVDLVTRLLRNVRRSLSDPDVIADLDVAIAALDPPVSAATLRKRRQRDRKRDKERDKERDSHADSHGDCPGDSHASPPLPVTLPLRTANIQDQDQDQDQERLARPDSSSLSANTGARARSNVCTEQVSAEWHRYAQHYLLMHAHSSRRWRTAYETIATAVNAAAANANAVPRETLAVLMTWWWKGGDGPIGSGRVRGCYATPELLADRVSVDLRRAMGLDDPRPTGAVVSPKVIALRKTREEYEAAKRRNDTAEEQRLEALLEQMGKEFASG